MHLPSTVAVAAIAAGALVLSVGSATAAALITSADIKDQTIQSRDIAAGGVGTSEARDGNLRLRDLHPDTRAALKGAPGVDGADGADGADGVDGVDGQDGVANVEADGPYPGATDLGSLPGQGDNSDANVPADGQSHTVWVQCAPGKVALGGGFRLAADTTQAAAEAINVLASEPTQVAEGALVYQPIQDDAAGSFLPNGWLVEVVNNGDTDEIVRPWVVCADAS